MEGLPALDPLDMVIEVLRSTNDNVQPKHTSHQETGAVLETKTQHAKRKQKVDQLNEVDYVPTNTHSSQGESQLYIFEDNEAVIIKGRSPTMRHVSRTHRVALDWLFDRINLDPGIQIKYVDTKSQLADILTKGRFSRDEWNHLLCLFNISHFSSTNCLEVMSKRMQEDAGEERLTAKSKPMMNLVSRCSVRNPNVLAPTASESPGKTKYESQIPLSSWNEQQPRTRRPVSEQPAGLFTQHTDRFVIDDDDMDSNTVTESDLSFKSRSFLH